MKKYLIIIFIFLVIALPGQDTIFVTSKVDPRLISFNDSLISYNTGKSICDNLKLLFRELSGNQDYDTYFTDGWNPSIKEGDRVDTLLGESRFTFDSDWPSRIDQFHTNSEIGKRIDFEFSKYDTLKVKPSGKVVGAEMPTLYIYKKPERIVIYQKLDRCWEKKMVYTTLDIQTHFIVNKKDKTIIPYNILRYYVVQEGPDKLTKTEWIDPADKNKIIKSFSY